ncbi:MAG: hypothetical protein IJQ39_05910 [Thermoguttaceae bacterium]|nr:hypothetical protein [Thermoguttaceae bacterium]
MKLSVSLLDILTCGFGGMLLLFLTTITAWQVESQQTVAQSKKDVPQFVVMLYSDDVESPLFELDPDGEAPLGRWNFGDSTLEAKPTILRNYAVLYCRKKPNDKELEMIKLENLAPQVACCRVIQDGKIASERKLKIDSTLSLSELIKNE